MNSPIEKYKICSPDRSNSICVNECGGRCCKPTYGGTTIYIPVTSGDLKIGMFRHPELTFQDSGYLEMQHTEDGGCRAQSPQTNLCTVYEERPIYCRLYPYKPAFLRIPITGEHVVWRDHEFKMSNVLPITQETPPIVLRDLLNWYTCDSNLIFPMIVLKRCKYSERLSKEERMMGIRTALDVARSEKELWRSSLKSLVYRTTNIGIFDIFTLEQIEEMEKRGSILATGMISEDISKFLEL